MMAEKTRRLIRGEGSLSFSRTTKKDRTCWTSRSNLHTAVPSQDTEAWRGTKDETSEKELFLTRTTANLSSSSPGSGMGSFRGMLCPLKSVCWSMLPAFPMFPLWPKKKLSPPLSPLEKFSARRSGKSPHALGCAAPRRAALGSPVGSRSLLQNKAHVREAALRSPLLWSISTEEGRDLENLTRSTRTFFLRCYPYLAQLRLHSQPVTTTTSMIHASCESPSLS